MGTMGKVRVARELAGMTPIAKFSIDRKQHMGHFWARYLNCHDSIGW
jgi:hypothetical protein